METVDIYDLDGCLADDRWRRHLIEPGKSEESWAEYHRAAGRDLPNMPVLDMVRRSVESGAAVAFVTARPRHRDDATRQWLKDACGLEPTQYILWSRSRDDSRGSVVFKTEAVLQMMHSPVKQVRSAVDDRADVLAAYEALGIDRSKLFRMSVDDLHQRTAADVLGEAADTYRERNAVYGSNYRRVAPVMKAMFPDGVPSHLPTDNAAWHLFELVVVKLTRFATSELTHQDSIHDAAVYAAMIEAELNDDRED